MSLITYENKTSINENPNVASINKVTADDMNEIKESVNDNYNKISVISNINNKEEKIGTFIDGKPIYKRTYLISNTNSFSLNNDMDNLIFMSCVVQKADNQEWRNIPWVCSQDGSYTYAEFGGGFYINPDGGWTVNFQIGSELANISRGVMTFIYTKTTD